MLIKCARGVLMRRCSNKWSHAEHVVQLVTGMKGRFCQRQRVSVDVSMKMNVQVALGMRAR